MPTSFLCCHHERASAREGPALYDLPPNGVILSEDAAYSPRPSRRTCCCSSGVYPLPKDLLSLHAARVYVPAAFAFSAKHGYHSPRPVGPELPLDTVHIDGTVWSRSWYPPLLWLHCARPHGIHSRSLLQRRACPVFSGGRLLGGVARITTHFN